MKKAYFLILTVLFLGITAQAQFNKPLPSTRSQFYSNEAKYNIGIIGGGTMTQWLHIGGTKTRYNQPFNIGLTGGLVFEYKWKNNISFGIEGLYAMRNLQLNYEVTNFPVSLTENKNFYRQLDVAYQEVNVQIPVTYYLGQGNIRPFVYAALRGSLPLAGKEIWQKKEILNYGTENQQYSEIGATIDTAEITAQNMRPWNVGIAVGAGVIFKINFANYYLLLKADAAYHVDAVNSFSHEEINGESQNVIGASYIDPYLLSYRLNTDITARVTIMFPLKKQLKGACMRWGEYD